MPYPADASFNSAIRGSITAGLTELAYGMSSRQMRSASEADLVSAKKVINQLIDDLQASGYAGQITTNPEAFDELL